MVGPLVQTLAPVRARTKEVVEALRAVATPVAPADPVEDQAPDEDDEPEEQMQ